MGWVRIDINEFNERISRLKPSQKLAGTGFLFRLLSMARRDDGFYNGTPLKTGQCVIAERGFEEMGMTRQNVRTMLSVFKNLEISTHKSTHTGTVITVCNFESLVLDLKKTNPQNNQRLTHGQPTPNPRPTHNTDCTEGTDLQPLRARVGCLPDEIQQPEPVQNTGNGIPSGPLYDHPPGWTHIDDAPSGNGVASGARSPSTELVRLGNMPMAQEIFTKWREVSGRLEIFSHGQIASGDAAASLAELATLADGEMGRDGVLQAIEAAYSLLVSAGDAPRTLFYVVQEIRRRNKAAAEGKERSDQIRQHRRTVALATAKFGIKNRAELEETYRSFREDGETYPLRYLMEEHRGKWWNLPDDRDDREEIERMAKEAEQFVAKKRMA